MLTAGTLFAGSELALVAARSVRIADGHAASCELAFLRTAPAPATIEPLASDGLIELGPHGLKVTTRGRLLVRTVAMHFDRYLREARQKAQYSRVMTSGPRFDPRPFGGTRRRSAGGRH